MKKTIPHLFLVSILTAGSLFAAGKNQGLVTPNDLEGTHVTNTQGEDIGHIDRLLLDPQSGQVRYAVIEVDKAWNWNDPQVAVPFQSLDINRNDQGTREVKINATKEKLENAPKFKDGDADRLWDKQQSEPVYSYWGVMWYDLPTTKSSDQTTNRSNQDQGTNQSSNSANQNPGNMKNQSSTPSNQ